MKKIAIVLGTRPEILKNYSIVKALQTRSVPFCIFHTGQHSDPRMNLLVFKSLGYEPTEMYGSPFRFGACLDWLMEKLEALNVDIVIVNGDTNASILGGLAALYSGRSLAHVEAGLRCYDRRMLEERNRIMVDSISDYLFTYTDNDTNLLGQSKDLKGSIHQVGNTTVDLITDFQETLPIPDYSEYAFITLHRRELLNDPDALKTVLSAIQDASPLFNSMIFPVHPHTMSRMRSYGIRPECFQRIRFVEPMLPLESLGHIKHAKLIITDSGVMQEEAYLFNVPCVTVRENTERHITIQNNANMLCGLFYENILDAIQQSLLKVHRKYPTIYGEPGVGDRIIKILLDV